MAGHSFAKLLQCQGHNVTFDPLLITTKILFCPERYIVMLQQKYQFSVNVILKKNYDQMLFSTEFKKFSKSLFLPFLQQ